MPPPTLPPADLEIETPGPPPDLEIEKAEDKLSEKLSTAVQRHIKEFHEIMVIESAKGELYSAIDGVAGGYICRVIHEAIQLASEPLLVEILKVFADHGVIAPDKNTKDYTGNERLKENLADGLYEVLRYLPWRKAKNRNLVVPRDYEDRSMSEVSEGDMHGVEDNSALAPRTTLSAIAHTPSAGPSTARSQISTTPTASNTNSPMPATTPMPPGRTISKTTTALPTRTKRGASTMDEDERKRKRQHLSGATVKDGSNDKEQKDSRRTE
jgi:hypothetical protein